MNENHITGNYRKSKKKATANKFFKYKTKIIGSTPADNNRLKQRLLFH